MSPIKPPVRSARLLTFAFSTEQFTISTSPETLPAKLPAANTDGFASIPFSSIFERSSTLSSPKSFDIRFTTPVRPPNTPSRSPALWSTPVLLFSTSTSFKLSPATVTSPPLINILSSSPGRLPIVPKKPAPSASVFKSIFPDFRTVILEIVTGSMLSLLIVPALMSIPAIFLDPIIFPENISGSQFVSFPSEFSPSADKSISRKMM